MKSKETQKDNKPIPIKEIINKKVKPAVTTTQVKRNPNPTGKGGFAEHPQNINPGGMPRTDISIVKLMLKQLGEADGKEADAIAKKFISKAKGGDFKFAKELVDRVDGKTIDRSEIKAEIKGEIDVSDKERNEIFNEFVKITKKIYGRKRPTNPK